MKLYAILIAMNQSFLEINEHGVVQVVVMVEEHQSLPCSSAAPESNYCRRSILDNGGKSFVRQS